MKLFQTCSKNDYLSCLEYSSTVNTNNTWILLPIPDLTLMSFCTKGLPKVAESAVSKSEGKPSPWEKGPVSGWMRGGKKEIFPTPRSPSTTLTHRLRRSSCPERLRLFLGWWILRLSLRLRAEWQHWWRCLRIKWKQREDSVLFLWNRFCSPGLS